MNASPTVVLLERDEQVIKDLTVGLSLVGMLVAAVPSAGMVGRILKGIKPAFVLVRLGGGVGSAFKTEIAARAEMLKEIKADPTLREIPLIALLHQKDEQVFKSELQQFTGKVNLPIEFPLFTQQIHGLIDGKADGTALQGLEMLDQELLGVNPELQKKGAATKKSKQAPTKEQPGAKEVLRDSGKAKKLNNMLLAYSVQMAVLEALKKKEGFLTMNPQDAAQTIAEETTSVCRSSRLLEDFSRE